MDGASRGGCGGTVEGSGIERKLEREDKEICV